MRKYLLATTSSLALLVPSIASHAETNVVGTWVGQFKGAHINVPLVGGPFSYRPQEAGVNRGPRFIENEVIVVIEEQQDGLSIGRWGAEPRGNRFVCAMTDPDTWRCLDSRGTIYVKVLSATEMKTCYLDNSSMGQGAGCAVLKKSN